MTLFPGRTFMEASVRNQSCSRRAGWGRAWQRRAVCSDLKAYLVSWISFSACQFSPQTSVFVFELKRGRRWEECRHGTERKEDREKEKERKIKEKVHFPKKIICCSGCRSRENTLNCLRGAGVVPARSFTAACGCSCPAWRSWAALLGVDGPICCFFLPLT